MYGGEINKMRGSPKIQHEIQLYFEETSPKSMLSNSAPVKNFNKN